MMSRGLLVAAAILGGAIAQEVLMGASCTRETAVVNPILVEVYVPTPTVLDIFGELLLTVSAAPTSISGLTYGTRTETETYLYSYTTTYGTATNAVAIPTSGSFDTPFILAAAGTATKKGKRDTLPGVDMLSPGGTTSDCSQASSWYLRNGNVYKDGYMISTPDVSTQELVAIIPAADIIGVFEIVDAIFSWSNTRFPDGSASFCGAADGGFFAVFNTSDTPSGCSTKTLYGIPGANCPGFQPVYPVNSTTNSTTKLSSTTTMSSTTTTSSTSITNSSSSSSTLSIALSDLLSAASTTPSVPTTTSVAAALSSEYLGSAYITEVTGAATSLPFLATSDYPVATSVTLGMLDDVEKPAPKPAKPHSHGKLGRNRLLSRLHREAGRAELNDEE